MTLIVAGYDAKPSRLRLLAWRIMGYSSILFLGDQADAMRKAEAMGLAVSHFGASVGDFRVDGRNLTWAIDRNIHDYAERFITLIDCAALRPLFPACIDEDGIRLWLRRYVSLDLYNSLPLWEAYQCANGPQGALYERSPLAANYLGLKPHLFPSLKTWLTLPALAFRLLCRPLPAKERRQFTIAVPLFRGVETPTTMSDTFWLEGFGIPDDQVLFYREHDDKADPLGAQVVRHGHGYAPTVLANLSLRQRIAVCLDLLWFPIKLCLKTGAPWCGLRQNTLFHAALEYKRYYTIWYHFFVENGIRFHINHGDINLSMQPYVDALEKACGGLDVSYEFSATGFIPSQLSRPIRQTQYFIRGAWSHRSMKTVGAYTKQQDWKASFITGLFKHTLRDRPISSPLAAAIAEARQAGKRLIGVFDVSCAPIRLLPLSGRLHFYDLMLEIVRANPNSVFLFKPQRALTLSEPVRAAFKQLEAERRCIWAEAGIDETPIQPLFRELDFAIGLGGYNSALIEAASEALPNVFYDAWDCTPDIFRAVIPKTLLLERADDLKAMIMRVDRGDAITRDIPEWQTYLDTIDPFRDGQGHIRMGQVLRDWLEAMGRTEPRDAMLRDVIERYRARHGDDKVL